METHLTGGASHKVKLGADAPERVSEKSSEANISAARRDDPPSQTSHAAPASAEQQEWIVRLSEGVRRLIGLFAGTKCLLAVGRKVGERDLQRIADAHNAAQPQKGRTGEK